MDDCLPAFPTPERTLGAGGGTKWSDGMTVRDYFAGQALSGMCAGAPGSHLVPPNAAKLAYEYADAMLAEREK